MKKKITNFLISRTDKFIDKKRPRIVVISGSVGKTSTTQSIATVLRQRFKVLTTKANYNTNLGVVMTVFDEEIQTNAFGWLTLSVRVFFKSLGQPKHEVYVLELGTDYIGNLGEFAYLKPDVAVVTGIAPEHMEFFKTIEAVAEEELSPIRYSQKAVINKKMVEERFLKSLVNPPTFYSRDDIKGLAGGLKVIGEHSLDSVAAAAKVGVLLGLSLEEMTRGLRLIEPQPGRMNRFEGVNESTLIDDTYNASPEAVRAALDYLYSVDTSQRIALLGNMNELGEYSEKAHREIGAYCDPKKLDVVLTLGQDSNKFLAEEAEKRGCVVVRCDSPYSAGKSIKNLIKPGAVLLLKGSQNGVFAEEATKILLKNPEDQKKLVRQKPFWLKRKRSQFKDAD